MYTAYINSTQIPTLIKTLITASPKLPDLINSKVSRLKVEKVLKPPQNPVIAKSIKALLSGIFLRKKNTRQANIIELKTLDIRVASGNAEW